MKRHLEGDRNPTLRAVREVGSDMRKDQPNEELMGKLGAKERL